MRISATEIREDRLFKQPLIQEGDSVSALRLRQGMISGPDGSADSIENFSCRNAKEFLFAPASLSCLVLNDYNNPPVCSILQNLQLH
jgi:hypothetical protein